MALHSILSCDLNKGTPGEKRDLFYRELQDKKWFKINELTTLWYASWKEEMKPEAIIKETKADVAAAAAKAEIEHYDAFVAVSGEPVVWTK